MRSGLSLFFAAAVLCGLTAAQADTGTSNQGAPPWHHTNVSRLDQARPGPAAAAEAGPQKYLHIEMQVNDPTVLQNREKFRIVDASGNQVEGSEFWGYNDVKKLLIFEGHWGSLAGLYLDGFGHREPLFDQVALPPVATTPTYVAPDVTLRRPICRRLTCSRPL